MDVKDIRIPGNHNVENYMAAIAAVWGEVSPEQMRQVAESFPGVEHRAEFVRNVDGADYYNDSIASSRPGPFPALVPIFPENYSDCGRL